MEKLTAKEWRRKWVEALRSGEYRQTTGVLRDRDGFCCLGVLCDIAEKGTWIIENGSRFFYEGRDLNYFCSAAALPEPVLRLAGLRTKAGRISESEGHSLSEMNDAGCSFARIADLIEAEPEGLFE